ncbi:Uncharacterised protein [Candidatus Burarchaeum australiense]|nr:Uncharacterised protein [Candidatus Burarchaeum australiense]
MDNNDKDSEAILTRLDAILCLLVRQEQAREDVTTREIISALNKVGLRDAEIAKILGKSRGYIASELHNIRKGGE